MTRCRELKHTGRVLLPDGAGDPVCVAGFCKNDGSWCGLIGTAACPLKNIFKIEGAA